MKDFILHVSDCRGQLLPATIWEIPNFISKLYFVSNKYKIILSIFFVEETFFNDARVNLQIVPCSFQNYCPLQSGDFFTYWKTSLEHFFFSTKLQLSVEYLRLCIGWLVEILQVYLLPQKSQFPPECRLNWLYDQMHGKFLFWCPKALLSNLH